MLYTKRKTMKIWKEILKAAARGQSLPFDADALMSLAREQATKAGNRGEVPIGAVLWSEGRILLSASNQRERKTRTAGHAEIELLDKYNSLYGTWRLPPDSVVVVTLEPCLMCTGALLQARASKIIYGCKDTKNAGLRLVQQQIESGVFDHTVTIQSGVQEKQCAEMLSKFFQDRRRQKA